ncbi:CLUMA_CG010448, isoform A [Clunio marinus]|uniref:CLUMA_CG010448, isoform A n=1 Tax=Clunio marinus TaxID=568069 RepID=A0A1J1IBI1_9DIPT|nr:CLUMA_CG010448, isoform A [Clunio marinus]
MNEEENCSIEIRKPSKILHFSDGTLEVFDDDQEQKDEIINKKPDVNEKELKWTSWLIHKAKRFGNVISNGLDYSGEKVGDFFGLTSPKYAYEIAAFEREQARESERKKLEEENNWQKPEKPNSNEPIIRPPEISKEPVI